MCVVLNGRLTLLLIPPLAVAVAPPYQAPPPATQGINFEAMPRAQGLPQEGTVVAYQLLEIDPTFCPVVGSTPPPPTPPKFLFP